MLGYRVLYAAAMMMLLLFLIHWQSWHVWSGADSKNNAKDKWRALFNGKDLHAWNILKGKAYVEEGALCLEPETVVATVERFETATYRFEYLATGPFILTVLDDVEVVLDDLRLFREQRRRSVEGFLIVTNVGDQLYRVTVAYSRAWVISSGQKVVRCDAGRYPLQIETSPGTRLRILYLDVANNGGGVLLP